MDPGGSQDLLKPMTGVRFASMSGPGPSGLRPEHLAETLRCNRRRAANHFMKAIAETQSFAVSAARSWSWILDSRFIFIAKKTLSVPSPIRAG